MNPDVRMLSPRKLIGQKTIISSTGQNSTRQQTVQLWQRFMPRKKEILHNINDELIAMQIFKSTDFLSSGAPQEFIMCAAVEVNDFKEIPNEMEKFALEGGLYAVFILEGTTKINDLLTHVFEHWLPNSDYVLDSRPHLQIMGAKYKHNQPDSEEEVCIPVKKREGIK